MASTLQIPRLCRPHQYLSLPPLYPPPTVIFTRHASGLSLRPKGSLRDRSKKKKKAYTHWREYNMKDAIQFSLLDAMRYLRAFEVGRSQLSTKYELAIKFRTLKNGPVIRNRLRLPHAVNTNLRIAMICPPDSAAAREALAAGASLVGEDDLIARIQEETIEFDRLLCHSDSSAKLNKAAGVGRILGPKGLMPSSKMGTVVRNPRNAIAAMTGTTDYREKRGVVRLGIGQLGFSPEQLQRNVVAFMAAVKNDMALMDERIHKEIHEVVLSSTNGPGFSLSGEFRGPDSLPTKDLTIW